MKFQKDYEEKEKEKEQKKNNIKKDEGIIGKKEIIMIDINKIHWTNMRYKAKQKRFFL